MSLLDGRVTRFDCPRKVLLGRDKLRCVYVSLGYVSGKREVRTWGEQTSLKCKSSNINARQDAPLVFPCGRMDY
jgi:hypothetical protein